MENTVTLEVFLQETASGFSDRRVHVFDVKIDALAGERLLLRGRVLDEEAHGALKEGLKRFFPAWQVDESELKVLRRAGNLVLNVATNLTSLHAEPSWLAELHTQLLFGCQVEVLEEKGRWVFVRLLDGYLGWAYRPYLMEETLLSATHCVIVPAAPMFAQPHIQSERVSQVLAGMPVQVVEVTDEWSHVSAHCRGWVQLGCLRAVSTRPLSLTELRESIVLDALRMTGVPYLWGGSSGNGIDCSGLVQLVHSLAGIRVLRDADMQFQAGQKVQPPYQPGDLLFFSEGGDSRSITHVGISLGGWQIVHSSRSRNGVYTEDVQSVKHLRESFVGACSYLGASTNPPQSLGNRS